MTHRSDPWKSPAEVIHEHVQVSNTGSWLPDHHTTTSKE